MALEVLHSGVLSLIQDRGRFGVMNFGITTSGVMNEKAYLWNNRLLDNPSDSAVIELSMGGAKFRALADTTVAITGAKVPFYINEKSAKTNTTHYLKKDDTIRFGIAKEGLRIYIGVKGGFALSKQFGSYSSDTKSGIGGINANGMGGGKPLKKGDILPYDKTSSKTHTPYIRYKIPDEFLPQYEEVLPLRVLIGYQNELFPQEEQNRFLIAPTPSLI